MVTDLDRKREALIEQEMIDGGVNRYRMNINRAKANINTKTGAKMTAQESNTSYGVAMIKTYVSSVAEQLQANVARMGSRAGRRPIAWEYLSKLDYETSAFIGCKVILDNISTTTPLLSLVNRIAGKIEDQARLDIFKIQDKKYFAATTRFMEEKEKATTYRRKRNIFVNAARRREKDIRPWISWPLKDKVHIGNAVLEAFIISTSDYIDGKRVHGSGMVEKTLSRTRGNKSQYLVTGTYKSAEWIRANQEICQFFTPDYMPTVIPPLDWKSPVYGGYHTRSLQKRKPLVKMQQKKYLKVMAKRGRKSMEPFYRTVNTLQAIPWEINTFVYNQMLKEFKATHGIKMPSQEPLEKPVEPDFFLLQGDMDAVTWRKERAAQAKFWTPEQKLEYVKWASAIKKHKEQENERVAVLLQISRTIGTARRYAFEDKFYFVWTADFRSRLYCCGTALSPQGTGHSKALIKFHNGVPLGVDGFEHLCIHTAGVWGNDKGTITDRVSWVLDNKEAIIATYNDPDTTRSFWGAADKPYLFLACCEELGECLQLSTQERESFISYIPCAQDGSCNGIQHYSAMLRDPIGAAAVNLVDSILPSDIYTEAGDKVREFLEYAILNDLSWTGKEWIKAEDFEYDIAQGWVEFQIARDCTKKPTMVIPYGGTKIGCRSNCQDYLKEYTAKKVDKLSTYQNPFVDLITFDKNGTGTDPEVQAITYLHHLVWKALDEVVVAARKAMKFVKDVTRAVCNGSTEGDPMHWTTLTGFRVYQDIKSTKLVTIKSHLEGSIRLKIQEEIKQMDRRKMQTSIAPNFVHSMDSTHLQMTVCLANDMGITDFACIHDSFGTHAGNTTTLHRAIRYAFYEMHSQNVLVNFWWEQVNRNPAIINDMPAIDDVKQGSYALKDVLKSTHFFR